MGLSAGFAVRTWGSPELSHGLKQKTVKLIGCPAPASEFEVIIMVEVVAE